MVGDLCLLLWGDEVSVVGNMEAPNPEEARGLDGDKALRIAMGLLLPMLLLGVLLLLFNDDVLEVMVVEDVANLDSNKPPDR